MGTEEWLSCIDFESNIAQSGEQSLYFQEMIIQGSSSYDILIRNVRLHIV